MIGARSDALSLDRRCSSFRVTVQLVPTARTTTHPAHHRRDRSSRHGDAGATGEGWKYEALPGSPAGIKFLKIDGINLTQVRIPDLGQRIALFLRAEKLVLHLALAQPGRKGRGQLGFRVFCGAWDAQLTTGS